MSSKRAAEIRLQDDAHVVDPALAQIAVEAQCVRRRRGVLHVDPDEVAVRGGFTQHRLEILAAVLVRQVQPERGELDADGGVEMLALDRPEDVAVGLRDRRAPRSHA